MPRRPTASDTAARVLLADGHRILVHERSRERGGPSRKHWVATSLLVCDVARIDDVRRLADQAREHGPIDTWLHNAGVWVQGSTQRAVTRRPLRRTSWRRTY